MCYEYATLNLSEVRIRSAPPDGLRGPSQINFVPRREIHVRFALRKCI